MKTKVVLPPPGKFQRNDVYMRRRWRRVQHLCNLFWSRWKKEYLATLQQRPKWYQEKRNMKIDDVVLIKDENTPRNDWSVGVIVNVEPDSKGLARSVVVRTEMTELRRPVHKQFVHWSSELCHFRSYDYTPGESCLIAGSRRPNGCRGQEQRC